MNPALRLFGQRFGLSAILGALVAGCLVTLGIETDWGQSVRLSRLAPIPARKAELVATLPPFALQSLESGFRETADRPLFLPTRRPVLGSAANAVVMKKGQFKLTGTSVAADMSVAYLLETTSGKTMRVSKGAEINGITLDVVDATRVVLKQGDESEELVLRTTASPPRQATPLPAPGQAGAPAAQPVPSATAPAGSVPSTAAGSTANIPPSLPRVAPFMPGGMAVPESSQMPGFVPRAPGLPPLATDSGTQDPNATAAQRRRRVQPAVPQK